jgi:HSP20 family protein
MNAEHPIRVDVTSPAASGHGNGHGDGPAAHPAMNEPAASRTQPFQTPFIDIHEGPDGLVLEADLPGVAQDKVSIQLEDNVLTLLAEVESPVPGGEARLLHEEYRQGNYQRSFILSDEVDRERISAKLENGVLRLTLPKAERARTRRIEIKSS